MMLSHKNRISAVFLFFFLFSANALLFSTHAVQEMGHDHTAASYVSSSGTTADAPAAVTASHQHDDQQGAQHNSGESCCDSHSHATILYQPLNYQHTPFSIAQRSSDPFRFIPEVYLDKFIPPQNLV